MRYLLSIWLKSRFSITNCRGDDSVFRTNFLSVFRIAHANAELSSEATNIPLSGQQASLQPPTSVSTTGIPQACASKGDKGSPSLRDDIQKTSSDW